MRLFKAIPHITTGLIGTTIALTQPGKLASKAAAGLGFLVLSDVISSGINHISKKANKNKKEKKPTNIKKALSTGAKVVANAGILALAITGLKKSGAGKFLKKEATQLANEINQTKLGKFVEKTVNPFLDKHVSKVNSIGTFAPIGIIVGSSLGQIGLANSLSKDIKDKATQNFAKGKYIQAQARAHYDSIDAQEI